MWGAASVANMRTMAIAYAFRYSGLKLMHGILNTLFSAEAEKIKSSMQSDRGHHTCKGKCTVQSGNLALAIWQSGVGEDWGNCAKTEVGVG